FVIGQNVVDGVNPVTLRDSQTGEVMSQLSGHNHAVESAAFSPDGAWIATAGRYHDVLLHSSDGKFHARFTSDSRNESLVFSADSKFLYVIKRNPEGDPIGQVLVKCSVPDLRIVQQLEVGISPLVCALSSDGRWLVTADNNGWVRLSSSGEIPPLRGEKLRGRVRCIAMNSNGSLLAAGCDNGLLYLWNFRDGSQLPKPLVLDSGQAMVTGVKFVSDAAIATTSRDGSVRIWNLDDALSPYVEFSPEADFLKSGPEDPNCIHARSSAGNIEEIDLDTLTSKRLADVPTDYHHCFTKTSDNSLFVAGSDNGIVAFEPWPQQEVYRIPYPKKSQACSWLELVDDDSRLLALYQDRLHCHRSSDGELLREFLIPEEGTERLAVSPNERYFIVLSRSILRCLELKSFRLLKQLPAQSSEYACVRFSPDGEQIAVGYQDGTVKLLQANSLSIMHVLPGHREGVNDMRFLDQHTLATSSSDLRFWDIDSGRELGKLELEASIYHMHYSPSRQTLYLTRRHQPMLMLSGQQDR
ncbi:MAG: hypothetical protein NXI32_13720, partial [bacterium]|nr:hypothetical protein [bacterium]